MPVLNEFCLLFYPEPCWKATVTAGKIVALAAYEMLNNPAKVKEIQESFKEAKAKEGK